MEKQFLETLDGDEKEALLGGEYEIVTNKNRGTLFIAARIRDNLEEEVDTATVFHPIQLSM